MYDDKSREQDDLTPRSVLPAPPLLSFDDRATRVIAAIWADDVRRLHRATLRAGLKLLRRQSVVRSPHAGPRVRLFTLRNTHDPHLSKKSFANEF
jgi:hypothetical protein